MTKAAKHTLRPEEEQHKYKRNVIEWLGWVPLVYLAGRDADVLLVHRTTIARPFPLSFTTPHTLCSSSEGTNKPSYIFIVYIQSATSV